MEKQEVLSSNRQLSRVYSLIIINLMLLISSVALNYFHLNNNKALYLGIAFDVLALIYFKPWSIMRDMRELFACQRMLEDITKTKVGKDYV